MSTELVIILGLGGLACALGGVLVGQVNRRADQREKLLERLNQVEGDIRIIKGEISHINKTFNRIEELVMKSVDIRRNGGNQ